VVLLPVLWVLEVLQAAEQVLELVVLLLAGLV
jgi:hypothetical protein